jgi:DNA modification methylase
MAGGVVSFIESEGVRVYHGDCIEIMRTLPANSVDSIVTDPPYGLEFMGKEWDAPWKQAGDVIADPATVGGFQDAAGGNPFSRSRIRYGRGGAASVGFQLWFTEVATEALRVLKPGGHLLAFGGTRTWHRLAVAIEDAGFEVRDSIAWMYGSGFPKSLDVSKAIDKRAGAQRDRVAYSGGIASGSSNYGGGGVVHVGTKVGDTPATPAAQKWQGWGTALKPAFEPIVVARKPLIGTVAENVLAHGTGALNIDGCRIAGEDTTTRHNSSYSSYMTGRIGEVQTKQDEYVTGSDTGRWPANVILDESQAAELDRQSGVTSSPVGEITQGGDHFSVGSDKRTRGTKFQGHGDSGGASRFFYCAKANKKERPNVDGVAHPTVKPIALMRYLVRLVTPPGGTVLEPFAGSGTTVEACILEGFDCIAIEMTDDYLPLINERVRRSTEDKEGRLL